jgi:carbon storage regulator
MLVVTRKKDEKLIIGNEIEIQVLKISKESVRIGIKAPQQVSVHRFEVYESIRAANLAAAQDSGKKKRLLSHLARQIANPQSAPSADHDSAAEKS